MRSTAQIRELPLGIEGNLSVSQPLKQFQFVRVALLGEIFDGLSFGNFLTFKRCSRGGEGLHFFLNHLKIIARKRIISKIDIVIKTLLNRWTYTQLDPRIEGLQSLRKQVSTAVPKSGFTPLVLPFQKAKGGFSR